MLASLKYQLKLTECYILFHESVLTVFICGFIVILTLLYFEIRKTLPE